MDKTEIQKYFDRLAPRWDGMEEQDDAVISEILDNARIGAGLSVLDVACGTGVLFSRYLDRGVASVTGIDLSRGMLEVARKKFPEETITLVAGDAEIFSPHTTYDRIMIYNALPHFPDPEKLIRNLSRLLKPGGILCVAHGMSREQINQCHEGSARKVSRSLLPTNELGLIFADYFQIITCIENERMYQLCGQSPAEA